MGAVRVLALIGILDANGRGAKGSRWAPASPSTSRSSIETREASAAPTAEIERASRLYAAARAQVIADVRSAGVRCDQAQQALDAWTDEIVPSLETEQRQAESAYKAGEIPLFNVLDVSRRLVEGRMRQLDAEADLFRARSRSNAPSAAIADSSAFKRSYMRLSVLSSRSWSLCLLSGCSSGDGSSGRSAERPAHVEAPRPEAELTTVKLSPDAVKRLGIETVVVKIDTAAATRSLGGEVTVPEGRLVTVTAPVAGTLSVVSGIQPGAACGARRPV